MPVNQQTYEVFHVFTDRRDEWTESFKQARELYNKWVLEHGTARLFHEEYADKERDELLDEVCIFSAGQYPL
jgi:hypothetical protein